MLPLPKLIESEIRDVQDRIATLKEDFARVIADTELPLEERWDLFVKAPDFLKEYKGWVEDFKAFPCEITWYDDFNKERHETVDTVSIVESIVEDVKYSGGDFEKSKLCTRLGITPDVLVALKEEILSKNLGSFVYDW